MHRNKRILTRRRTALATAAAAALTLSALAVTADAGQSAPETGGDARPAADEVLFDDFDYTGHDDPALTANGWSVRDYAGGPGVPGAAWAAENVTFAEEDGNSLMRLETSTAGTARTTEQAEISTRDMKFRNGTYAARVHFADEPGSGPDGDRLVQTFYTINELKAPMDPDYAEYDFEYLPNGGWGETESTLFTTSYETYRPDPWETVSEATRKSASFAGWHDLVLTIDDSAITYWIDGEKFAEHGPEYLPEKPMTISFNQWLIDLEGQTATEPRSYTQQVDYVLHVKDEVLTPGEVAQRVTDRRAAGTSFEDTVPAAEPGAGTAADGDQASARTSPRKSSSS